MFLFKFKEKNLRLKSKISNSEKDTWCFKKWKVQSKSETCIDKKCWIRKEKKAENDKISESESEDKSDFSDHISELKSLFTVSTFFSFSFRYALRSFWIFNHGVSIYIYNDTMKHRFVKKKNEYDQIIIADSQELFVAAYEHIRIEHKNELESRDIVSTNAILIFEFITNVISEYIFQTKELNFNTQKYRLHKDDVIYDYARWKLDHYFMKDNIQITIKFSSILLATLEVKYAIVNNWHEMLVHSKSEMIKNLRKSMNEVKISDKQISNKCETCGLFKAHKLVFRFIAKLKHCNKFFHRIIYDFMQFIAVMNKNKWIFHFICFKYSFNLIVIYSQKSDVIRKLKKG